MKRKNIVWNLTALCPFCCSFCCVSATHVCGFRQVFPLNDDTPVVEGELSFNQQMAILDQLDGERFKIDFSGGDVLINPRNVDLILAASQKLGASNVGLSIPGTFTTPSILKTLSGKVSSVEITLDNVPGVEDRHRPLNYAHYASVAVQRLVDAGFTVGIQTVLRKENMFRDVISELYSHLKILGVNKWSLLRLAPVGRGYSKYERHPSIQDYIEFADVIDGITADSLLEVHYQYLLPRRRQKSFRCRAVEHSIGISPTGEVSACFWAFKPDGKLFDQAVLGKLPEQNIEEILRSQKAHKWSQYGQQENYCPLKTIMSEV
jgi:MoaA/NifB/PqqE/SkfB family radical SAM enzyme